jgi:hypothetical protein
MTTNLWTVGQGIVTRRLREQMEPVPAKRSSRTPPKAAQPVAEDGSPAAAEPKGQKPQVRRVKRKKKRARR